MTSIPADRAVRSPSPDGATSFGLRAVDAHLLGVALGPSDEVAARWATVRERFTAAEIDDGRVHPLLPLVGEALTAAGVDDHQLGVMRGVRRHTFVAQQLLLADLAAALEVIDAAGDGARALLLGGVVVALRHYPDPSLRPMTDVDVLVDADAVDGLVRALETEGWRARERPAHDVTRRLPSLRLVAPDDRCTLVLHWRLVPWLADESTGALWARAGGCRLDGRDVPAAGVDDLLVHVITRAYRLGWGTEPRWIADLVLLLRSAGASVGWDRLVARVTRGGVVLPVRDALACASAIVDVPVPERVRDALVASAGSVGGGMARRYAAGRRTMVGTRGLVPGRDLVVEWHRQTFNLDASTRARRFVPFVLGRTGADHAWSVPAAVVRHRRGHA
jgi:hypothetical protein